MKILRQKIDQKELSKGFKNTLIVNLDFLTHDQVLSLLQKVNAWAFQRKVESKSSWKDITLQITWAFTSIVNLWWEKLLDTEKYDITENHDPLEALFQALVHEFLGVLPPDASHHASQFFMSKKLCNLYLLQDYFCTMKSMLYKIIDHQNITYVGHYLPLYLERFWNW